MADMTEHTRRRLELDPSPEAWYDSFETRSEGVEAMRLQLIRMQPHDEVWVGQVEALSEENVAYTYRLAVHLAADFKKRNHII